MHETSDDVRLEVGPDGIANVQHHIRYRVVAGHFKTFDIIGVDPRIELSPEVAFTPEKGGAEIVARVEALTNAKTPGTLRIMIDEGKGLGRGAYVVDVKYRLDLVATKMLTRDGAMWKVAWTAPPAPEGHDGARVIFDFPAAPTEPRLAAAAESNTTLATLRRTAEHDELELVRAHIPRGEAAIWSARIDPKAFPRVSSPELRPPPPPEVAPPSMIASNLSRILVACGLTLFTCLLAMLLREKQKAVRVVARSRGLVERPLLRLPFNAGPFLFGISTAAALAMLLWYNPILGAAFTAFSMMLAAHREPQPVAKPRAPGSWQDVPASRALLPKNERNDKLAGDWLDLSRWAARGWFALLVVGVVGAVMLLRAHVPQIAIALPLTASALIPIFATGTRSQLPPTPLELAARVLRPTRDTLAATIDLAHVDLRTIGRVVNSSASSGATSSNAIDEVRLACTPRDRTPGLLAIELALASPPGGFGALPEILVRFEDGSPAAERITKGSLAALATPLSGRTKEERVIRLIPEEPTANASAALLGRLLMSLEGRRAGDRQRASAGDAELGCAAKRRWKGTERRRTLTLQPA